MHNGLSLILTASRPHGWVMGSHESRHGLYTLANKRPLSLDGLIVNPDRETRFVVDRRTRLVEGMSVG